MDNNCANVVGVGFKGGDLLRGVIVVNADLEVIRATDDPILAGDEAPCTNRYICKFERFDYGLCFVGPYISMTAIESRQNPGLGRVKVDAFDPLRSGKKLSLFRYPYQSRAREETLVIDALPTFTSKRILAI